MQGLPLLLQLLLCSFLVLLCCGQLTPAIALLLMGFDYVCCQFKNQLYRSKFAAWRMGSAFMLLRSLGYAFVQDRLGVSDNPAQQGWTVSVWERKHA